MLAPLLTALDSDQLLLILLFLGINLGSVIWIFRHESRVKPDPHSKDRRST
ncbi:hypothetical protein J7E73_12180 [Paenibacillus albidus]|uniref:hypothetical protein n=1 Tax=Paenibacillus albidus TaxID=2041023 RepID=UPI001BE69E47|nr:hypothetical protein [Paenibacillus albidus]MBT2289885.1 hypothetical protein [Paenibacillus albidus]